MHCTHVNELLEKIKKENQIFSEEQIELLKNITNEQHPKITLVTCSDSRVDPGYFKIDPINKIFVIRNIGNNILTSEGSVNYGVEHLNTPILLILAHTNCGAIKAAINEYDHCTTDIKKELDHIMPALINLEGKDFQQKWIEGVEKNLELQLKIAEDKFKSKIEKGELTIIGAILDIDNSYGEGIGKIHIKKIIGNGKCDIDL